MSTGFDPYYRWLGIPPRQQPPSYYRLLGLTPLESDVDVIRAAAERQMAHVRTYHLGQYAEVSQRVLNELAAAKACLLDPQKKAEYDRGLRRPLRQLWSVRWAARGLLVAGLVLVLLGRGCNSLSERAAARAKARLEMAEDRLREESDSEQWPPEPGPKDPELRKRLLDAEKNRTLAKGKVAGVIESTGDQDMFTFTAPASGRLQIDLVTPNSDLDPHVFVYDSGQQLLADNDDGMPDQDSRVVINVEAGKTYYVRAAANESNTTRATGAYELVLAVQASEDDFPNTYPAAHAVNLARTAEGKLPFRAWQELRQAAREAAQSSALQGYWHAWLFLIGSVCLTLGLLLVGFGGQGAERWICLAMVVVITFSLFVVGAPWGSLASGVAAPPAAP